MKYILIVSINEKEWGTKESKGSYVAQRRKHCKAELVGEKARFGMKPGQTVKKSVL